MTAIATKPTTATAIEDDNGYQRRLLTMAMNNGYEQWLLTMAIANSYQRQLLNFPVLAAVNTRRFYLNNDIITY
jgi:hypothetical protein